MGSVYKNFWCIQRVRSTLLRTLLVATLFTLLWLAGCQPGQLTPFIPAMRTPMLVPTFTPTPALSSVVAVPTEDPAFVDAQGLDIAERRVINVYERVAPSVVSITTQVLRRGFFFEVPEEGAGSGFILDQEGHILTNYHVVDGAQSIDVSINDDFVAPATVVGIDRRNDIAVLKVEAPAEILRPVQLGSSANLLVGQRAIAIGNPFGQFGRTLTIGVISSLNRTIEGSDNRTITGIIQTDAAINRGNSGGPLLDSSGRVIGINTAIFSPTGTSAGVGFAVPVDTVKRLLPDLLALGRYRHPWLGVRYAYELTASLANALELSTEQGLLIVQLYDRSPLAQADVRGAQQETVVGNQRVYVGGDILIAINGQPVQTLDGMETLLEDNYTVGDPVTVTLVRDGQPFDLTVELAEEPN
jgi:S1-C subfamily serine protease